MGKLGLFLENVSLDKINDILSGIAKKSVKVEIDELTLPGKSNIIEDGSVVCGWYGENNFIIPEGGPCNHCSSIITGEVRGIVRKIDRIVYIEDGVRKLARFAHIEGRFCCNDCVFTFQMKGISEVDDKKTRDESIQLLREIEGIENPRGKGLSLTSCIFTLICNGGVFEYDEWRGETASLFMPESEIYFLPVSRKYSKR